MRAVKKWLQFPLLTALCAAALLPAAAHADPSIQYIQPTSGPIGTIVAIHGTGFKIAQGMGYVLLGGRFIPVLLWTDNVIRALVNPLAFDPTPIALDASYNIQVINFDGSTKKTSNSVPFLLTSATPVVQPPGPSAPGLSDQPVFECFQKPSRLFCVGDIVTFLGSGFGRTQGMSYVVVNGPVNQPFINLDDSDPNDPDNDDVTMTFAVPVLAWSENAINVSLVFPPGITPVPGDEWSMTVFRSTGSTSFKSATGTFTLGVRDKNGNCVLGRNCIQLSATTLDFGHVELDDTVTKTVTVTNCGSVPLHIGSVMLVDGTVGAEDNDTDGWSIDNGCANTTLAPGASCTITLTFKPTETDAEDQSLVIVNDAAIGGQSTVALTGFGEAP